ncbi:hypothetical protein Q3A66_05840 [Hymenobacter sp. BT770]|uniref:hypothetical protein n=1 Tax=Hymenobacter sp. BT770 TaxID=2886942 RepID=UPI001D0FBE7F|nr:hypothetical protein [Hymenobacter sp. BT770]MCC3152442.1 hypothetical protein [Hymenobacter sp. BT770]MDO3414582.1 hypothetical protein [Hymenobacter sp. BT770]
MKKLYAFLLLGLSFSACQQQPVPLATDQVNTLVGNAGYVAATGQQPTASTNDDARVQAHLAYAERLLRQRTAAGLSPTLAQRRAHVLDLLHSYWTAGVFPRNYDYPGERRPCFIDRDGRLCAVGFLIAETAGRPVAERINKAHQYDLIADMRTPALAEWVQTSGLTKQECALIQPTYGYPVPGASTQTVVPVATRYAVGTAVWSGFNTMLGVANASQFNLSGVSRGVAYVGLLSGAGQVLMGAFNMPADETPYYGIGWNPYPAAGISHAPERTVSTINIGAGTATVALSTWNLLHHRSMAKASRTAVGVVNFPGHSGGTGLSLTHRF